LYALKYVLQNQRDSPGPAVSGLIDVVERAASGHSKI
jgi:hypothetical protein